MEDVKTETDQTADPTQEADLQHQAASEALQRLQRDYDAAARIRPLTAEEEEAWQLRLQRAHDTEVQTWRTYMEAKRCALDIEEVPHLPVCTATYTCAELLRLMQEDKFFYVVPQYTQEEMSAAVERLLLKIPLESFYVDASESTLKETTWSIVAKPNAPIRLTLTALRVFQEGFLVLKGLKLLPELNGSTWSTLTPRMQNRILTQAVAVHEVQRGVRPEHLMVLKRLVLAG